MEWRKSITSPKEVPVKAGEVVFKGGQWLVAKAGNASAEALAVLKEALSAMTKEGIRP